MSFIIAIDGPSASGKGTLARALAAHLHFAYLDTGAVYRAVAHSYLEKYGPTIDLDAGVKEAILIRDHFDAKILENPALRTEEVAQMTSKLSSFPEIRAILLELQHNFAHNPPKPARGAVLDGRDIGTVVCPNATLKLFVTASTESRAIRRTKELQNKGISVIYADVLRDMAERDMRDKTRVISPTLPAEDAIILDTSHLTAADVFAKALELAKMRGITA